MSESERLPKSGPFWSFLRPVAGMIAGYKVQRLLGFWVMVAAHGGFDAFVRAGVVTRAGAYKSRREWLDMAGFDVDEFQPELSQLMARGGSLLD